MQEMIWLQHLNAQRIMSVNAPSKPFKRSELAGASYFDKATHSIELLLYESQGCLKLDLEHLTESLGSHYFYFHDPLTIVQSSSRAIVSVK